MPNPYLTPSQVAANLGVTTRRVSLLCREGRFQGAQLTQPGPAGRWLIPAEAVAAFLADDTKRKGPLPKAKR